MKYNKNAGKPVAIITGSAGGIGRAVSIYLISKGYRLVLVDISQEGLGHLQSVIGNEHQFFCTDITDIQQVRKMVSQTMEHNGRIDVLVNTAGMVITEPWQDCSLEKLRFETELNYLAPVTCIKEVLPHMIKAGNGTIVSVASLAAILPLAVSPGYTASKFALRGLTISLNMALRKSGIHVGCVCPSAVDTPMLIEEAVNGGSNLNFLQEPLTPEAIAKAVWKVIHKKKMEICVPAHEGISCKLGGFLPSILPAILPLLEKLGERNRLKYIYKKKLTV